MIYVFNFDCEAFWIAMTVGLTCMCLSGFVISVFIADWQHESEIIMISVGQSKKSKE